VQIAESVAAGALAPAETAIINALKTQTQGTKAKPPGVRDF
jgi:hypothetical protein